VIRFGECRVIARSEPIEPTHRINDQIRISSVRLVSADGKVLGIVPTAEALGLAPNTKRQSHWTSASSVESRPKAVASGTRILEKPVENPSRLCPRRAATDWREAGVSPLSGASDFVRSIT
jgi:Translation initiation factor IF-3, N-terminal domain